MNGLSILKRDVLMPSATNPRKNFNPAKLQELADTIKAHGVLEPLLVRGLGNGRYEIIAGERRWRAAEIAGLKELPCIEKVMSDQEVLEVQYIENLQRDDLTAIEEAQGFQQLVKSGAYTPEKLAAKLGKSRAHVFARLKLCKLEGPVREALEQGKISHLHAEDIAKWVPGSHQAEAIVKILEGRYGNKEPMSVRETRDFLQREYSGDLAEVPWDLKDKNLLPAAGPCSSCPKRSDNCKAEFPDLDENTCTDIACFQQKRLAFQAQALAAASKKEKALTLAQCEQVFDKWGHLSGKGEFIGEKETLTQAGYRSLNQVLKKPKAEKFVAVNPDGEIVHVFKRAEIMVELKESGALSKNGSSESKEDKAKREAKEKLDQEIAVKAHKQIAAAILEAAKKLPMGKGERALWLLALRQQGFGNIDADVAREHGLGKINFHHCETLVKTAEKWPDEKIRLWVIQQIICERGYGVGAYDGDTLWFASSLLKVDMRGIEKKVREELTAKTKKTLVHKVTHGKPLPGEKKTAKPAKVDRNGHTKKLPEQTEQPGLRGVFTTADKPVDPPNEKMSPAERESLARIQRARWAQAKTGRASL
jgi:ParB/RepB/Spo0J family partition protein